MPNTLKIVVEPYKSSEEPRNSIEDRNVDLVRRGFPRTDITIGQTTITDISFVGVEQLVVVFDVETPKLLEKPKDYLAQLKRDNVIKSWALSTGYGEIIEHD